MVCLPRFLDSMMWEETAGNVYLEEEASGTVIYGDEDRSAGENDGSE